MEKTKSFQKLLSLVEKQKSIHLKNSLQDEKRNSFLISEWNGITMDYSRQKLDEETLKCLFSLAEEMKVKEKIHKMFSGEKINKTEKRCVYHVALRSEREEKFLFEGENVVKEVYSVLDGIKKYSDKIRQGKIIGSTGKILKDVICIGIGGSYLGPEFLHEALKTEQNAMIKSKDRRIRFLSNVDPIDIMRATEGFEPETTLVVIISKTFTTAETILNAKTIRTWLMTKIKSESDLKNHMCAVSSNLKLTSEFGIDTQNVFGFWDWVGGRYSVSSAVGVLPLSLQYGFEVVEEFLKGCRDVDKHFHSSPIESNLPVLLGLLGVYNSTFLKYNSVAVLPYSQALVRFASHIQQLTMESNGKRVDIEGKELQFGEAGQIFFGEPGTNGQHSFYQLLHQGRTVPAEFIGFCKSQQNLEYVQGKGKDNHDELMSNFFAQPDALAFGKGKEEVEMDLKKLANQGEIDNTLIPHKVFPGDRPSTMLLFPICSSYYLGCLLSLYEHRTAVEGFLWNINSFDQWGVELGKVLAKDAKKYILAKRENKIEKEIEKRLCSSTKKMMEIYINKSSK